MRGASVFLYKTAVPYEVNAAFTLIRGDESDFLGQYRRNSHAMLALRYSF